MNIAQWLIAAFFPHRRVGVSVGGPSGGGTFTPSGADWAAVTAAVTDRGAVAYFWQADGSSLRVLPGASDGVSLSSPVGYANNWFLPGDDPTAATATGALRPTYAAVGGVNSVSFSGNAEINDNERLSIPNIGNRGTFAVAARLLDTSNPNQTLLEIGSIRLMAQMSGFTGPTVRVGGGVQHEFGLSSMAGRWTVLLGTWNEGAGTLKLWHDAVSAWVELAGIGAWVNAPATYIARNSFEPANGAPGHAAVRSVFLANVDDFSTAQLQSVVDLVGAGTSVVATVPGAPPPGVGTGQHWQESLYAIEDYAPASPITVNVSTQDALNTAITNAAPGHRIKLAAGSYVIPDIIGKNGTAANFIIIEAASLSSKPTITSRINIYNSSYVIIHGMATSGLSPAVRIGRMGTYAGAERQHNIHIARCNLLLCGMQAITTDRYTNRVQIKNNRITTNTQAASYTGTSSALLAHDIRPHASLAVEYRSFKGDISHNIFKREGTLNSISGPRAGHDILLATSDYAGNADQQTIISYNHFRGIRKYAWESKVGGLEFRGNFVGRADSASNNYYCLTRQAGLNAPAGTGANVYKGNVYDNIYSAGIQSRGNAAYHYANGERMINGTGCDIFCQSGTTYRAADRFRMDYCEGGTLRVGYRWSGEALVRNVEDVELHQCKFSVQMVNQTRTVQSGLTGREVRFPTHTLLESECGPEVFRP